MKIDGTSISPVGAVQAANRVSQVGNKPIVSGKSEKDNLAVSDKAQIYKVLLQKVKETSEVREERVAELKEQIANGRFKVDPKAVAGKMLGES